MAKFGINRYHAPVLAPRRHNINFRRLSESQFVLKPVETLRLCVFSVCVGHRGQWKFLRARLRIRRDIMRGARTFYPLSARSLSIDSEMMSTCAPSPYLAATYFDLGRFFAPPESASRFLRGAARAAFLPLLRFNQSITELGPMRTFNDRPRNVRVHNAKHHLCAPRSLARSPFITASSHTANAPDAALFRRPTLFVFLQSTWPISMSQCRWHWTRI